MASGGKFFSLILSLIIISLTTSCLSAEWVGGHYSRSGRWVPGYHRGFPTVVIQARPLSKWELKQQELNYKTSYMRKTQAMRYAYQERSRVKAAEAKEKRRLRKLALDPKVEALKFMYAHLKKAEGVRVYMSKDLKYRVEASVVATDGVSLVTLKKKDGNEVTVSFDKLRPNDRRFLYNLGAYESVSELASNATRISFAIK